MKKHPNPTASDQTQATVARTGETLSVVLVAMLIMSIGVVSLAALFPISVLRTAQATQLTHSVFLRNNAEAAVESKVGLLSNAQIFGSSGLGIIDPLGVQLVGTPYVDPFGVGVGVGTPLGGVRRTDGLASTTITPAQRLALAEQLAALPDSWSLVLEEPVTATNLSPSPPTKPTITVANSTTGLNVRNGSTANAPYALHRLVMFDATGRFAVIQPLYQVTGLNLSWWNVNADGTSLGTGPSLPNGFIPTRVRIEAQDRRYTWMMTVRKRWVPVGPVSGTDGQPGVAGTDDDKVNGPDDNGELHYSGSDDDPNWAAELDVAVFYNRSFRAADETAYSLTFPVLNPAGGFDGAPGVSGVDDDNNAKLDTIPNPNSPPNTIPDPGEVGFPGSDDNRTVMVTFTTAGPKPYLKKGGYMLEPNQLKWYRILDLKDVPSNVPTDTNTVLLLDQNLTIPTVGGISGIFMKGIIEVYPLGSRTGRE